VKYLSVCSGIEAATVAWHPLDWEPVAFSEIDPFPSAVIAHHYPTVPNRGDMTKFQEWPDATVDLLVGGTPCQSFSVAGLRAGLDDPRGSLLLTYLAIARRYRPRWVVWENVPGVLSADDGRAFGSLLGGLGELGYGFAYRVLDAQYFGLAQRRKRVFVVGHLGDWRRAAAVLFERESLSGHPAPRREAGQVAPAVPSLRSAGGGLGTDFDCDGGLIAGTVSSKWAKGTGGPAGDECYNLTLAHALRAEGFDASEDGTGRGTPLVPCAFDARQSDVITYGDQSGPLDTHGHSIAIAFSAKDHGADAGDIAPTLRAGGHVGSHANGGVMPAVAQHMSVRRLTPRECERLQGFPISRDHATIELCLDQQRGVVTVALSCRRSLNAASPVAADESPLPASTARPLSATPQAGQEPHVLAHVHMRSGAELQELRSHGRSIWSASDAGASAASLRPTARESIAAVVVQHLPVVVSAAIAGKAASPVSIKLSIRAASGDRPASTCGAETAVSVSGAGSDAWPGKFTTSDLGRLTPLDDSTEATSLCSVLAAISGCIPSETLGATFSVEIVADIPYTLIPYRGKPAADGPRYKALGNSMAVPVMAWIGRRIQMVDELA